MCNSIFIFSKQSFRVFLYLLFLLFQCSACSQSADAYDVYWVVSGTDNPVDVRWENYLRDHLNRRSGNKNIAVSDNPLTDDCLQVMVHIDSLHDYDYSLFRDGGTVRLIARNDEKMLWLIYQFISALGDERVNVSDLPPAIINLKGCEGDFAFEYRGIYSSANSNPELMPITASHNIDYDWGLWGHNLRRVFTMIFLKMLGRRWMGSVLRGSFVFHQTTFIRRLNRMWWIISEKERMKKELPVL